MLMGIARECFLYITGRNISDDSSLLHWLPDMPEAVAPGLLRRLSGAEHQPPRLSNTGGHGYMRCLAGTYEVSALLRQFMLALAVLA